MSFADVNVWAVLAGAVGNMIVGALWYAPFLFGDMWLKEIGKKKSDVKGANKAMSYAALLALIESFVLAQLIAATGALGMAQGVQLALWIWVGFVATAFGSDAIFNGKSLKLYGINVGYHLVALIVMGAILGAWA